MDSTRQSNLIEAQGEIFLQFIREVYLVHMEVAQKPEERYPNDRY